MIFEHFWAVISISIIHCIAPLSMTYCSTFDYINVQQVLTLFPLGWHWIWLRSECLKLFHLHMENDTVRLVLIPSKPLESLMQNKTMLAFKQETEAEWWVSITYCKIPPRCFPSTSSFRYHTSSSRIRALAAGSSNKSLPVLFSAAGYQGEGLPAHYLCQQLNLSRDDQVIFCT